jgi:hypothetical protein
MTADPHRDHGELEEYEAWVAGSGKERSFKDNRREGVRPSRMLALGLLLVPFNFYLGRFDILPDPLGWLLAFWALRQMGPRHGLVRAAMWCSVGGLVLSCLSSVVAWSGESVQLGSLGMLQGLLPMVVAVLVCSALIALVGDHDRSGTRQANIIRAAGPALALVMVVLAGVFLSSSGITPIAEAAGPAIALTVVLVASLAVDVWFLILLVRHGAWLDGQSTELEPLTSVVPATPTQDPTTDR